MGTPSKKQVEANRRNAKQSTGPRTQAGKQQSRLNGLKHGFASEVVVPEADREALRVSLERWRREAGPDNVVEDHLIRRAAIGSVILDRLDRAREDTRLETAREAVRSWEEKKRHRARRRAQDLEKDPANVALDLQSSAFGCDWMIRQWQSLDAPLRVGNGWDQRTVARAQRLLGLPEGVPGPDAEPEVRALWRLAGAVSPRSVTFVPPVDGEDELPTDPIGARAALRGFIADQVDRLIALRDEAWERVEGPEREAVVSRALAADTSKEGQLRHRYHRDADRSSSSAIRLFLNLRDRHRREMLEIAKEARHCSTPRVPVGGGWWREPDSDPAPPGFERIGAGSSPFDSDSDSSPIEPGPSPFEAPVTDALDPDPAETANEQPPADRPTDPPHSPQRSEPISGPGHPGDPRRNPDQIQELRNEARDASPVAPGRTQPSPSPDRPGFPGPDRADRPGSGGPDR